MEREKGKSDALHQNVEDILEALETHMKHISYRTYFREKKKAIHTLGTLLWGYTSPDLLEIVDTFLAEQ